MIIRPKSWNRLRPLFYYSIIIILFLLYSILMIRASLNRDYTIQQIEKNKFLIKTLGYHDTITFTVRKDPSGAYTDFELLESWESPLYASDEDIQEYFSRLKGIEPEKLDEVDSITGATITIEAIRNALQGMEQSFFLKWKKTAIFAFLWALVILLSILKKNPLLFLLSCLWFVIVGIIYNSPAAIYSLFYLTTAFRLLPFLALTSVLLYRNVYCGHICPFGFLQKLARLLPVKKRYRLPPVLKTGKYILLFIALTSLLMGNQLYLEPFAYLFSRRTIWWLYFFPLTILAVSLFIPLFWCRGFCPMGAAMHIGRVIRKWFLGGKPPHLSIPSSGGRGAVLLAILCFSLILLSNVLLYL